MRKEKGSKHCWDFILFIGLNRELYQCILSDFKVEGYNFINKYESHFIIYLNLPNFVVVHTTRFMQKKKKKKKPT